MKKLPIGIQDFSNIIEEGYIYIDKTEFIYKLINGSGKTFFLSRPRRFGKSLLINTMESFYKGEKNLFKGLFIENKTDWNKTHPVIKLDWTSIGHANYNQIKEGINEIFVRIGKQYDVEIKPGDNPSKVFDELIYLLYQKTGKKVVVLIDEYDVPILDNIEKSKEVLEEIREFLQGFYRILKASDGYLQFVFLTGVTRFAKVSIFSALNNIIDISLDKDYAAICGLTHKEIEKNLSDYIDILKNENNSTKEKVLKAIQYWYNGFSWDGDTFVYNPFSTLMVFKNKIFDNYWFSTGTPSFLIKLIKERNDIVCLLNPVDIDLSAFNTFNYETLDTKLLLFQTGYLTVKNVKKGKLGESPVYTLCIPNNEVKNSLFEHLISSYTAYPISDTTILRDRMRKQIIDCDSIAFEKNAKELFAKIPYQLHIPKEAYYHSIIMIWLSLLGFEIQGEISTNKGRIDAVLEWENNVVIAEVKFKNDGKASNLLEDAINQIKSKNYYERYDNQNNKILLLGIGITPNDIKCKIVLR